MRLTRKKDIRADIPSDSKAESTATHVGTPTRGRSRKASDTNAGVFYHVRRKSGDSRCPSAQHWPTKRSHANAF